MSYETERFASITHDTQRAQAFVKMLREYTKSGEVLDPDQVFTICATLDRYLEAINISATVDVKPLV